MVKILLITELQSLRPRIKFQVYDEVTPQNDKPGP